MRGPKLSSLSLQVSRAISEEHREENDSPCSREYDKNCVNTEVSVFFLFFYFLFFTCDREVPFLAVSRTRERPLRSK